MFDPNFSRNLPFLSTQNFQNLGIFDRNDPRPSGQLPQFDRTWTQPLKIPNRAFKIPNRAFKTLSKLLEHTVTLRNIFLLGSKVSAGVLVVVYATKLACFVRVSALTSHGKFLLKRLVSFMGMNSDDFVGSLNARKSRKGIVLCGIIALTASGIFKSCFLASETMRHAQVFLQCRIPFLSQSTLIQ